MADELRAKGAAGVIGTAIGAFSAGQRDGDRQRRRDLIKLASAGCGAAALFVVLLLFLRSWERDRAADRGERQGQHAAMVTLLAKQHQEDREDRKQDRCVAAQLTDTVRAAIWHEKPRSREECR